MAKTKKATTVRLNDLQKEILLTYFRIYVQAGREFEATPRWRFRRKAALRKLTEQAHGFLNDALLAVSGQQGVKLEMQPDGTPVVYRP